MIYNSSYISLNYDPIFRESPKRPLLGSSSVMQGLLLVEPRVPTASALSWLWAIR